MGSAKAFETLWKRYQSELYRYLFILVQDKSVADDLFQEVWTQVYKHRTKYRSEGRFKHWLFRIAHNASTSHARARKFTEELPETLEDLAPSPEREALGEEELRIVIAHVGKLPQVQREALLLRVFGDMSFEQIGGIQGVDAETAKSRVRYALAKLNKARTNA